MGPLGPIWAYLNPFKPNRAHLVPFGPNKTHLVPIKPIWYHLTLWVVICPILTYFVPFEPNLYLDDDEDASEASEAADFLNDSPQFATLTSCNGLSFCLCPVL